MSNANRFRIILFALATIAILFNVSLFRPHTEEKRVAAKGVMPDVIPPEGWYPNNTHGKVPGDPERTTRDLRRLYQIMTVYKSRHGSFPTSYLQIWHDAIKNCAL